MSAADLDDVRDRYRRFAVSEAPGRSDVYAAWAARVVDDDAVGAIIARLPPTRRQAPLVFGAARLLGATVADADTFAAWVVANADALVSVARRRSVQTNEPLRNAVLLPALSMIDGPIALLEVGASAGLLLYPDRATYEYRSQAGVIRHGDGPVGLRSEFRGDLVPTLRTPDVVWRAGIDLAPLDVGVPEDCAWLRALIWPGERERADRIDAAIDVARAEPPLLVAADAADALSDLAAGAPSGATLVVTTPGVLPHVPRAGRERIIATAQALPGHWITFDSPGLHDAWTVRPTFDDGFALALDGDVLARADPLGRWVEWRHDDSRTPGYR